MTDPPTLDSRPAKRARTEGEPGPVVRCDEIWYDDGNLVLQAERTQFRVHRSILCKQSIVFKDMKEASCTSAAGSTTVEGCPVVELQDSAEAVKYMLRCIYDAGNLHRDPSYTELLLALRMGHKYLIPALFDYGASHMRILYPSCLASYEEDIHIPATDDVNPFELLSVARTVGLETTIPALCLSYLRILEPQEIVEGLRGHRLSPEDIVMFLLARSNIMGCSLCYWFKWTLEQHRNRHCEAPAACTQTRLKSRDRVLTGVCLEGPDIDIAHGLLNDWNGGGNMKGELCSPCAKKAQGMYEQGQEKFWEDLPSFFGLKPWKELRDFRID
ncbi:hypothetical protein EV122DRAFT_226916 [Schizophyllum commune]